MSTTLQPSRFQDFVAAREVYENRVKGLQAHDGNHGALIEDLTERASILRNIDPNLVGESRLSTGIRIIDRVIGFFYELKCKMNQKTIETHLPAFWKLKTYDLPQDQKTRQQLVFNLYQAHVHRGKAWNRFMPPMNITGDRSAVWRSNREFAADDRYVRFDRELTIDQVNPRYRSR
jgi:hypothetical protein